MQEVNIVVKDDQTPAELVEDVTIRVYNEDGSSLITSLTTDEDGEVTTDLPEATYWIRLYKIGYSFSSRLLIVVSSSETNGFDISCSNLTLNPPAAMEGICKVSGYLVGANGSAVRNASLRFSLPEDARIANGSVIVKERVIVVSDAKGYVEFDLIQSQVYKLTSSFFGEDVLCMKTPAKLSCNLQDLIYPRGNITSQLPAGVTVTVGEEHFTDVTVETSSGLSLPDEDLGLDDYDVLSFDSDDSITAYVLGGELGILATEAGVFVVTVYSKFVHEDLKGLLSLGTIVVTANE